MRENIFDYLKEYGFITEDIYRLQDINDKLFFVDISFVEKNINFLESKGLSNNEVIKVVNNIPYLLTIGSKKKELLDNIYNNIFTKEELKRLIIEYPITYIVNPLELQEVINYLKENNIDIKQAILNNKEILNKTIDELETFEN